jgi:geranylgeranylglycerol-phosphate geranylgeranyltransferase
MHGLGGYVRLIRPVNCLMMGFAVVVGVALANPNSVQVSLPSIAYGFITGFTLTGASMAINDYYDRGIDAINEPGRPIPSGVVKPRQALVFAAMLTGVGFVAAFLANLSCLVIAVVAWLIFSAYTTVGKRSGLPGNFLVSACVVVPFIYGSAVALGIISTSILLFVSMVFLSNTGREITKGIVDVQGDKGQGVKTLAVRWGEKRAAVTAAVFYVAAVLLSPLPWLLNVVSFWFLPLVAVTDVGLVASSFMLLKDYSRESARKVKKTVLLCFLLGLLAFIAGTVW